MNEHAGEDGGKAGQHLGEGRHIGLAVARRRRDGVQFEDFTRQVLVQPAGQALARSVLQAVARDVPPAQLIQAVAHLMELMEQYFQVVAELLVKAIMVVVQAH